MFSRAGYASFVGDAVMGAWGGCFGLAIQDYCAVHVVSPCFVLLARTERGDGVHVNMKGKRNMPEQFSSCAAKSIMPYPHVLFCSDRYVHMLRFKGF